MSGWYDVCCDATCIFYIQCSSPKTLKEAISKLEEGLRDEEFQYEIRREFVLSDLLRAVKKLYHPLKRVKTWFVGEDGVDTGGLTREMWRLFGRDLQCMCEGKEGCLLIKHDAAKLQVCMSLYYYIFPLYVPKPHANDASYIYFNLLHSKGYSAV